jgi:hypothetical protein
VTLPIAIAALLLATDRALPAIAATHPSAPVEFVQYRAVHRHDTVHQRPAVHRDGYNAHAAAPAAPDATRAGKPHDDMPAGWRCMERRGDDPSAFPSWEFCK